MCEPQYDLLCTLEKLDDGDSIEIHKGQVGFEDFGYTITLRYRKNCNTRTLSRSLAPMEYHNSRMSFIDLFAQDVLSMLSYRKRIHQEQDEEYMDSQES